MTHSLTSRGRSLFVIAVLLVAPGVVALWPSLDERSACERAKDWVLHAGGLPEDYAGIVALPVEYRKAVFRRLPADLKVQLWQEQLRQAADDRALSAHQREFILRFARELTPERYARKEVASPKEIRTVLAGRRDLWSAFTRLGPPSGSFRSLQTVLLNMQDSLRRRTVARAFDACSCNNDSDWCNSDPVECDPGAPACHQFFCEVSMSSSYCEYSEWGCGTLWMYPCNGECSYMNTQ